MKPEIELRISNKFDPRLRRRMQRHYSQPKGFVGRSIVYAVHCGGVRYGYIVAGSATLHLRGRKEFCAPRKVPPLNCIVNNTFFNVNPKKDSQYPLRNFTTAVVATWRERVRKDWKEKYGDTVRLFETLIELPRTGELYRRDGWTEKGITEGWTCKRTAGKGTDSWSGKRIWMKGKQKRVFFRWPD
jgi:hypothetical protein